MSQPSHRLPRRIAKCSLIAAIALLPASALAPDSATDLVLEHGPTAGIALIAAAGGATLIARWPRRRPTAAATVPALAPTPVARPLPAGASRAPLNARTVHAVRPGERRNQLPSAAPRRAELPAATTGGAR